MVQKIIMGWTLHENSDLLSDGEHEKQGLKIGRLEIQ